MAVRFMFRPRFEAGNSVAGYLVHYADENCLFGMRGLGKVLRCSALELAGKPRHRLASWLWRSEELSSDHASAFSKAPAIQVSGERCRTRFCTFCVAWSKKWVHPVEWDYPASYKCAVHHCLLIDRCQVCDHVFDHLEMPRPGVCQCGAEVAEMRSPYIPVWAPAIDWVLAPGRARESRLNREMRVVTTLRYMNHLSSRGYTLLNSERRLFLTIDDVFDAERAFKSWPKSFGGFLRSAGWHAGAEARLSIRSQLCPELFPAIQEALESEMSSVVEELVDAHARAKDSRADEPKLYFPEIFSECAFPVRNTKRVRSWSKKTPDKEWHFHCLAASTDPGDGQLGADLNACLPKGRTLRLVLIWLTTMARQSSSPMIRMDTAYEVMEQVGLNMNSGGAIGSRTNFFQQVAALGRTRFASRVGAGTLVSPAVFDGVVIEGFIWEGPKSDQRWLRLSDWFYDEALNNAIPVDGALVAALRSRTLALDAYFWLSRQNADKLSSRLFHWERLLSDFCSEHSIMSGQRKALFNAFQDVATAWPGLRVSTSADGIYLALDTGK